MGGNKDVCLQSGTYTSKTILRTNFQKVTKRMGNSIRSSKENDSRSEKGREHLLLAMITTLIVKRMRSHSKQHESLQLPMDSTVEALNYLLPNRVYLPVTVGRFHPHPKNTRLLSHPAQLQIQASSSLKVWLTSFTVLNPSKIAQIMRRKGRKMDWEIQH